MNRKANVKLANDLELQNVYVCVSHGLMALTQLGDAIDF